MQRMYLGVNVWYPEKRAMGEKRVGDLFKLYKVFFLIFIFFFVKSFLYIILPKYWIKLSFHQLDRRRISEF